MWKYCLVKHDGEEQLIMMDIEKPLEKTPFLGNITEALEINHVEEADRMNSWVEWSQPRVHECLYDIPYFIHLLYYIKYFH